MKLDSGRYKRTFLLLILLAIPVTVFLVGQKVYNLSRAQSAALLYFSPGTLNFPPNNTVTLMANFGSNQVGYIKVEILFDKTKINLTDEVITTDSFGNVIKLTGKEEANGSGKISVVLGLSQSQLASAPINTVEIVKLPFGVVTGSSELTKLTIGDDVQIVTIQSDQLSFAKDESLLNLNGYASLSPTTYFCSLQGDANEDCHVDGVDYAVWFINIGKQTSKGPTDGDFNINTVVDGVDYAVWFIAFREYHGL